MSDEEDDDKPSGKRLTDAEYEAAKDMYERGEDSLADIAAKYGVTRQALYKRFTKAGVVRGSKAGVKQAEKVVESFVNNRSQWIEETRFQGYQALKQVQLVARKIAMDQLKKTPPAPMGEVDADLRAVGRLNKILCDNIEMSLRILEADKHVEEDNLPQLLVEDLTDEDILNHHKSTGVLHPDATVEDMLRETMGEEDEGEDD